MTEICTQLTVDFPDRQLDEFYYHTEASYSSPKKHLELLHCHPMWSNAKKEMNHIGCYHSLKHTVISNTCVILANRYELSEQSNVVLDDVTKDDILRVIRRRYFFTATLISNDTLTKYYYQNPAHLISKIYGIKDNETIQTLPVNLLKYSMVFYFQHNKNLYVNKIATRICGLYQLHGDVLVINEQERDVYTNLSIHEVREIKCFILDGRLYDRQLRNDEIHEENHVEIDSGGNEVDKKKTPFWSKYIVITKRMAEWQQHKNDCLYCGKEIIKPIICDKCFRSKFCSQQCQKEFDSYHTDECINPKSMSQ